MPAFGRLANPFVLDVSPTSASTQVTIAGDPRFPSTGQGRSFIFTNPNQFCVRLAGTPLTASAFVPVTETTGWLMLPMSQVVFSSQLPKFVSVMSVTRGGLTAGTGTVELAYGTGS